MEQAFTKDHILELYLNEIYLGNRSYGVAAAALNYFGKSLNELTIEEAAYLAALPKGPNNYNPKTKYEAAVGRRNWVIDRMIEDGYVDPDSGEAAKQKPLVTIDRSSAFVKDAQYFSEEVRREISQKFGRDSVNEGGLIVRTTLDPKLQEIASNVFHREIQNYDRRHGWRGPLGNIPLTADYREALKRPKSRPERTMAGLKPLCCRFLPIMPLLRPRTVVREIFRWLCFPGHENRWPNRMSAECPNLLPKY